MPEDAESLAFLRAKIISARKAPAKGAKVCYVLQDYFDAELDRYVNKGEYLLVGPKRAKIGETSGFYRIDDV